MLVIVDMPTSDLERTVDSLGRWLVIWTIVVAAGLVVEYADDVTGFLVAGFKWLFSSGSRPKLLSATIVGAFLITGGVIGEGLVEFRASKAETDLRRAYDETFKNLDSLADQAKRSADQAADDAGRATVSAQKAKGQAEVAKQRADEIGREADQLRSKTAELSTQLLSAESEALAERKKEAELEESVAPRVLDFQIGPGNKTSFDDLKPFAGVQVAFEVLTDAESRRAAQEIGNVLQFANWHITEKTSNPDLYIGYYDGVSIWYAQTIGVPPMTPEGKSELDSEETCRKAAEALNLYLLSKGWESRASAYIVGSGITIPEIKGEIRPNTLTIVVGFKPSPFFEPDWVKQVRENERRILEWEKLEDDWEKSRQGPRPARPALQEPETPKN
jgi:hypothetical protein